MALSEGPNITWSIIEYNTYHCKPTPAADNIIYYNIVQAKSSLLEAGKSQGKYPKLIIWIVYFIINQLMHVM